MFGPPRLPGPARCLSHAAQACTASLCLALVGLAVRLGLSTGRQTPPLHTRQRLDARAMTARVLHAVAAKPDPEASKGFREGGPDAAEPAVAHAASGVSAHTTQIRQDADFAIAVNKECLIIANVSCRCRGLGMCTPDPEPTLTGVATVSAFTRVRSATLVRHVPMPAFRMRNRYSRIFRNIQPASRTHCARTRLRHEVRHHGHEVEAIIQMLKLKPANVNAPLTSGSNPICEGICRAGTTSAGSCTRPIGRCQP